MLSHIVSNLYEAYVEEVLTPQLGSSDKSKTPSSGGESPKSAVAPDEASAKRIRQAVYDIRYRARREDIPLDQAFNQYMSHTSMNAIEKKAVREKLGLGVGGGGATPVKEEIQDIEEYAKPGEYYLRVDPSKRGTGEKPYVRKYDPSNPKDVAKRHKLETRGIKTTATKYGTPYEGGSSGAGEKYEKKYGKGGENTVGDLDQDGTKEPNSHEYAGVKDNAIKKAIAKKSPAKKSPAKKPNASKKKSFKEGFSNWRQDLYEISNPDDEIESSNQKKIKEKKVDNYSGTKGKRVVNINPHFNECIENLGGHLIESIELTEDFLIETSNNAAEYFFRMGLNDDGLEIVIEEMGLEKFNDFVFYISEDFTLTEARRSGRIEPVTKSGKSISTLRGGAKASAIRAKRKEKESRDKVDDRPSQMKAALRSQSSVAKKITADKGKKAVEKAKETQPSKKPVRDAIARGIFGAVKAYQSGMERHRAATKTAGKALRVAGKAASEFGKGVASGVKSTATAAQKAKKAVVGEDTQLDEKITSKTPIENIIKHFVHSKDPKFSGDTKKNRINRALGAYYGMHKEAVASIPGKSTNQQPQTSTTQRTTQQQQQKINAQKKALAAKAAELNAQRTQLNKGIPLPG